jgi:hypothetical protein
MLWIDDQALPGRVVGSGNSGRPLPEILAGRGGI